MKRLVGIYIIFALTIGIMPIMAEESVNMTKVDKSELILKNPVKIKKSSLLINDEGKLDELIELQKKKDAEDIELLWKGTVENNLVIEFALKKLATPESQRRIHSSLMAKTLSAIVSGSSFVPSLMGANPYIQTSSFAAGRLAQQLLNKKNVPQEIPLSDTELIELAGLVETLQDRIIELYYNYKNSLSLLKDIRSRAILYNKNYSKALDCGDLLEITISSSLYDNMTLEEFKAEQNAKKYHLELQRLAGKKAVESLYLYQYNFNTALFKGDKNK